MTRPDTAHSSTRRTGIPGCPMSRHAHRWLPALWLIVAAPAVAAPAPEYGPEAEARFRERCDEVGASPDACQALMERLQARLGYEAFLAWAERGPGGFRSPAEVGPSDAPTVLARRP
jgi:hypothetical protein